MAAHEETVKPTGLKQNQYQRLLSDADGDGNGSVKQDEMGAYLNSARSDGTLTQQQATAVWNAQGWKTSYEDWWASAKKAEDKAKK